VKEVAGKLFDNALTGMPVVSGDEVIGIVTEGDVVMENANVHIPSYINILSSFLYLEDPDAVEHDLKKVLALTAEDLMTEEVITVDPEDSVTDLATIFKEKHINPIPVVDKNDKLVGIVSRSDIVKLLAKE
ncbi:CBS domain-containing protein, partial [Patescibacteria group bacterium]|nr:CBS domain-containing protein [Patescibacteria group bacterium]